MTPRDPRRGQVNFRSHNSCLSLGAPFPGRRRACVLFGVFFRGGYSPTGLPGDTVWLALPPTGWGGLSVLSQRCHASVCYSVNLPPYGELLAWCVDPAICTLSCVEALVRILICSLCKASWACNGRFFLLTEARMGSSVAAFCRIAASGDY